MSDTEQVPASPLITPAEAAAMFHVHPRTIVRWANAGKLKTARTLGGHRRYDRVQVERLAGVPTARTGAA